MTAPARPGRVVFADIGRGIGALLVVYSHLTYFWLTPHHIESTPLTDALNVSLRDPLHLTRQNIGQIAVPIFFLVSGFIVTPIALREGPRRFVVKRLLRVYPLLAVAVAASAAAIVVGFHPLDTGPGQVVSPASVLASMSLVNFVLVPQLALVGVAWTLVVEMIFYALLVLLMPVLRRWTWYAICVELTVVAVTLAACRAWGDNFFLFAVSMSFLPIILLGQLVWAVHSRRVGLWPAVALGAGCWTLYVWADRLGLGRVDGTYNLALAYALLLFLIGLLMEPRLRPHRVINYLSERSYSIYLLHGVVLLPVLDLLATVLPVAVAVPAGLAVTLGAVELAYRSVERPSHRLGGWLARRVARPSAGRAQPRAVSVPRHRAPSPRSLSRVLR